MAITSNDALANGLLDHVGDQFNSGTLELRSGSAPGANNAATGTLIASITLPATAFAAAASRSKAKSGTWQDPVADATGTIGHYRLKNGAGTRVIEGTVTATGGGGDMTLNSVSVTAGDILTITAYTLTPTP